jgi:aspartate carbamoyltransferase regulatory subunit
MGRKGIIKISERFFRDDELNKIALIAPNASVNIIRDFKVVEKKLLTIPKTICGIVKCINPMCVTNHEDIPTRFRTIVKGSEIQLQCVYCEKITDL